MTQTRLNRFTCSENKHGFKHNDLYALNYGLTRGQNNYILRHLFKNLKKTV